MPTVSSRRRVRPLVVIGLAGLLLAVGALLGTRPPAGGDLAAPAPGVAIPASQLDRLDTAIAGAQDRLRRVPGDHQTWATLGLSYLERARITADPTWYAQAEGALHRSLTEQPEGNPAALAGLGALANARHDFAGARELAGQALRLNPYHAEAYGVLADAETQLGNAGGATEAVQAMLDLRPGLPALARASYDLELRGQVDQARALMEQALAAAFDPSEIAFCHHQLGELAWHAGDLAGAQAQYAAAAAADPAYLPARQGLARVAAARGDLDAALAGYADLTGASPTPDHLLEYAELLQAAGRADEAAEQVALAQAAHELFTASGGTDDLTGAELAIAQSRPAEALELAEAEWQRRQFTGVADALSWALHLNGRDEEALDYARRAGALGERNAEHAFHRGIIELSLGDDPAAGASLARALDLNPHFSPVYTAVAVRALAALESS